MPEALENNFNLPFRCSFRPLPSKPILPNISSNDINSNDLLKKDSYEGLKDKFKNIFKIQIEDLSKNEKFLLYKDRLDHELDIIIQMKY